MIGALRTSSRTQLLLCLVWAGCGRTSLQADPPPLTTAAFDAGSVYEDNRDIPGPDGRVTGLNPGMDPGPPPPTNEDMSGGQCDTRAGGVTVANAMDVDALSLVCHIRGDLIVQGTLLQTLSLPNLVHVDGTVRIAGNAELTELALPSLEAVGGDLIVGSVVRGREGEYDAQPNPRLSAISFPQLGTVGGSLVVQLASGLLQISAPKLAAVGALILEDCDLVSHVGLPQLATADDGVRVESNGGLESLHLSALRSGSVTVVDNAALVDLRLDALVNAGALDVRRNAVVELEMGALVQAAGTVALDEPDAAVRMPQLVKANVMWLRAVRSASLPKLQSVDEYLFVGGSSEGGLRSLWLPELRTIGGGVDVYRSPLRELDAPVLAQVSHGMTVRDNTHLQDVRLGSLATVGGAPTTTTTNPWNANGLQFTDNPSLRTLELGRVSSIGGDCVIVGNESLSRCELGEATVAGRTDIDATCQ